MAASSASIIPINDTAAHFRSWGSAISAALAAGGLVQTSDTGQINWTTVSAPGGATTFMGYEIWRSADATGSLHNWYMKIEYGSGTATNTPAIKVTFGWSSDGAGTISSTNTIAAFTLNANGSSGSAQNTIFSSGTGWFVFSLFEASNTTKLFISVERTRDATGVEQDEIFFWARGNNGSVIKSAVLPFTGAIPTSSTSTAAPYDGACLIPTGLASYASNFGVGTQRPIKGGFCMDSMNFYWGNSTDFPSALASYTLSVYGSNHTYLSQTVLDGAMSTSRLIQRYE